MADRSTRSIAMYKRRLRRWGLRKNSRPGARPPITAVAGDQIASSTPRYLPQNDIDEAFHTLLDLFVPWIAQAGFFWARSGRAHCPPRALYIYDAFTRGIALAAASFQSGDAERGGDMMRQAFVDLEHTLAPKSRSTFTLPSLFFALATLNLAGLFEASRLLVVHAAKFVIARAPPTSGSNNGAQHRMQSGLVMEEEDEYRGHISHPLPQIIHRLQVLRLKGSDTTMAQAIFRAWSVYHQAYSAELTGAIALHSSDKEFWNIALGSIRDRNFDISGGISGWTDSIQPILDCLKRQQQYAEGSMDDDFGLLNLDQIISIYSFSRDEKFEEVALELATRIENQGRKGQWYGVNVELLRYYEERGDLEKILRVLARIIPDTTGTEWQAVFTQCWRAETPAVR